MDATVKRIDELEEGIRQAFEFLLNLRTNSTTEELLNIIDHTAAHLSALLNSEE